MVAQRSAPLKEPLADARALSPKHSVNGASLFFSAILDGGHPLRVDIRLAGVSARLVEERQIVSRGRVVRLLAEKLHPNRPRERSIPHSRTYDRVGVLPFV